MPKKSKSKQSGSKQPSSKAMKALAAKNAAISILDSTSLFKVKTSDNVVFELPMYLTLQAKSLGELIENIDDLSLIDPIPLQDITAETLKLLLEWMEHHKGETDYISPSGPRRGKYRLRLPEWDYKWLRDLDNRQLFSLICASNYLDLNQLMDYSCKTVANMAKGKTVDEMRVLFGIKPDVDDEEAALNEPGPSNAIYF